MLSQDHDADVRREAGDPRDDAPGLVVPEPRSPSAARLLEMTARETDQWRSDARAEAAEIVASAREEAEDLLRAAQQEAAELVEAARADAARSADKARAAADVVRAESEGKRVEAQAEVDRLQQVASDHETQLRQHLTEMLERLDR